MQIAIREVAHHRNGVWGEGFHAVRFIWDGRMMVATVFEGEGRLAILDATLAYDTVEFGVNSWRAEDFEKALRAAVDSFDQSRAINPVYPDAPRLRAVGR